MTTEPTTSSKILAYNLKHLRSAQEATQEEVVHSMGISARTYQDLEAGTGNPTLETLSHLSRYFRSPVSALLRLNSIRLTGSEVEFFSKIKAVFLDEELGFLIRSFEGFALWGNRVIAKVANHDVTTTPLNLFDIKSEEARGILKAQIEAEKNGIIQPYLNTSKKPSGEVIYFRIYPTLVFPRLGTNPLFSATYMTTVESDTEARYFRFCESLLKCV